MPKRAKQSDLLLSQPQSSLQTPTHTLRKHQRTRSCLPPQAMHPHNLPLLLLEGVRQVSCPVWAMPRVGNDWDVQPSAARWRKGGLAGQYNTIPTCFWRTREVCTSVLKQAPIMMWLVLVHAILALPLAGTVTETHVGTTLPHTTLSKVPQERISPHYGGDDATR